MTTPTATTPSRPKSHKRSSTRFTRWRQMF